MPNETLHWMAIPLRSIVTSELDRCVFKNGKETFASVRVGINRCGSEYNRGTGCGKTALPGLWGGVV
jgi:hypothetical protein